MRYMLMFRPETAPDPGMHACKQELPEMAQYVSELRQAGTLVMTQGLMGSETGARVRLAGGRSGKLTVRDGPFAEAKELVAGVVVVDVKSREEAVEIAKKFLQIAGGGEGDVLQVIEPGGH